MINETQEENSIYRLLKPLIPTIIGAVVATIVTLTFIQVTLANLDQRVSANTETKADRAVVEEQLKSINQQLFDIKAQVVDVKAGQVRLEGLFIQYVSK